MRQEKKIVVEEIKGMLQGKKMLILTDHTGLSANQMNELRSLIKKNGSEYMVVKNRLLKRALDEQAARAFGEEIDGPTGIAVTSGDCAALSKIIVDFAKKNEAPRVKASFLEGAFLTASEVGTIAALPPREVLIACVIGGMQAPLSAFIRGLAELTRRFVYVLDQVAQNKSQIPNPPPKADPCPPVGRRAPQEDKSQTSEGESQIQNPPPKEDKSQTSEGESQIQNPPPKADKSQSSEGE
jgi:large subunit ribosomal protein L10